MRGAWVLLLTATLAGLLPGPASAPGPLVAPSPSWDAGAPAPARASGIIIAWVIPRTDSLASEAFALANAGPAAVALSRVEVHDGEGRLSLRGLAPDLAPGDLLVVASDPDHLASRGGPPADVQWSIAGTGPSTVPSAFEQGDLRLSNSGETLWVTVDGRIEDAVVWGRDVAVDEAAMAAWSGGSLGWSVGEGEILQRRTVEGGWMDTHGPWDWRTPRRVFLGQTQLVPFAFEATGLSPLIFPDDGARRIREVIEGAHDSVFLSYYQLTQPSVLEALAGAARSGLDVRVFGETAPAGESAADAQARASWAAFLEEAGAAVAWDDERYRYRHGKFGGADGRWSWVGSENLRSDGQRTRGWGVLAESGPAHDWLDSMARDGAQGGQAFPRPTDGPHRLLAAPDHTVPGAGPTPLLDLLGSAQRSIDVQALTLPTAWGRLPWGGESANPYVEALLEAAARNVTVRVLLSGTFAQEGEGNRGTAALLEEARRRGLPVEARLHETGDGGHSLLHNKGFVVDGRWSVVGSLNLNLHSAASNREVVALLDDATLAAAFREAFDADWASATGRPAGAPRAPPLAQDADRLAWLGAASIAICTLVLLGLIRRHRRLR